MLGSVLGGCWSVKVSLGKVELIAEILATQSNEFYKFTIQILDLDGSVTKIYENIQYMVRILPQIMEKIWLSNKLSDLLKFTFYSV